MKIKNKTWFIISLIITLGLAEVTVYNIIAGDMDWLSLIIDILMIIVMTTTTIKFIEFKKTTKKKKVSNKKKTRK